jgi:hypothetical protein
METAPNLPYRIKKKYFRSFRHWIKVTNTQTDGRTGGRAGGRPDPSSIWRVLLYVAQTTLRIFLISHLQLANFKRPLDTQDATQHNVCYFAETCVYTFHNYHKIHISSSQSPATIILIRKEEQSNLKRSVLLASWEVLTAVSLRFSFFWDSWTSWFLKMRALRLFETSGATHPRMQRYIPEVRNLPLCMNYSTSSPFHLLFYYCFKWLCWALRVLYKTVLAPLNTVNDSVIYLILQFIAWIAQRRIIWCRVLNGL